MAKLPKLVVVLPKKLVVGAKASARPSSSADRGDEIRDTRLFDAINNSARNYRSSTNVVQLMRHLARSEGPFGTAVHNITETAATDHTLMAYDSTTHQFSPEGWLVATSILARLDTLSDYTKGFSRKSSTETLKKKLIREAVLAGGVSGELVLDEARLPESIQVVGIETLRWLSDGKGGAYPAQQVAGKNELVELNIPNFWVEHVHPDADQIFARSMLEPAIKLLVYFEEFMEDIRRVVRQSGHNRTKVTLNAARIAETAPPDVKSDKVKLLKYMEATRAEVQRQLETIEPEEALVLFDSVEADSLQSGMGVKMDYTPLLNVISGLYATSMKTPPSVLGLRLESGSQALGNVETLIFLKSVAAAQTPVETFFNRALTLACRLMGVDVYIDFSFDCPDLRPDMELQTFKQMKQTIIMERLSLGFITDEEAAAMLRTGPRPPGAPKLSGTMFHMKSAAAGGEGGPTFPGDTAMGKKLQPDKKIPRQAGGKSQRKQK